MLNEKKILIDLTNYGDNTCGFGQIAESYADYFAKRSDPGIKYAFLLPKRSRNNFISPVECHFVRKYNKFLPVTLPKADLWHSVNQQQKLRNLSGHTKFILTIHDLNFLTEKNPAKAARYLKRLQHKVDKADAVTAISHYTADIIRNHVNLRGKEIKVIYNGVDRIDNLTESRPGFATGRPFFFAIGQIRRKKNFHLLLDVMAHMPEYDLYICGNPNVRGGVYAAELKDLIQEKGLTNVFLPGKITQAEKVWLYRNCEAFLFPSQGEGFGLPAIEAMQFGKAVFAAARTSLPEICGGHAFLWEHLDPDKMTESIRNNLPGFYDNKERIERIKDYAATFSYEKHIAAYAKLYSEVLGI